jgi:hypothetical protein
MDEEAIVVASPTYGLLEAFAGVPSRGYLTEKSRILYSARQTCRRRRDGLP